MANFNECPLYFLGANTSKGFVSWFSECFDAKDGWHTYIIKGGPGTGKSTLMKRAASRLIREGQRVELCPCASDPDSLDAVILPQKRLAILDGTSPHCVEPQYAGASEEIVNLGACWRSEALMENSARIFAKSDENSAHHKKASACIKAAGELWEDIFLAAERQSDMQKLRAFSLALARKHIPKNRGEGREWRRFLSGITPKGIVFLKPTLERFYNKRIAIEDEFGAVASVILSVVRKEALAKGYEIISCFCPLKPQKLEHILIPSLGLSFSLYNQYHSPAPTERIIHARRFMQPLGEERNRIRFEKRCVQELLRLSFEELYEAKAIHDELESIYISAMDRARLSKMGEDFIKKLVKSHLEVDKAPKKG